MQGMILLNDEWGNVYDESCSGGPSVINDNLVQTIDVKIHLKQDNYNYQFSLELPAGIAWNFKEITIAMEAEFYTEDTKKMAYR
ncbi:hypothetical protein Trydic_g18353 [Trypoxylus dichotomus]